MSKDAEILELCDDGSFEIPSPVREKLAAETEFEEIPEASFKMETFTRTFKDLISEIAPGGYKVRESGNSNLVTVVIMMQDGEKVETCKVQRNGIEVSTDQNRLYSVSVPIAIRPQSSTSSSFENFLYVQMKKA